MSAGSASSSAPPALVASTIKAASLLAAGQAAGVVTAQVAALTDGVVKAMYMTKLKIAAVVLLVLGAFGAGAGAIIHATPRAEQKDAQVLNEPPPSDQSNASSPQKPEAPDADRAAAEWVIANGGRIDTAAGTFQKGDPLGDGPFKISAIRLTSTDKITDDDLVRLAGLTKLNNLFLARIPVGDAGLKHLANLKSLESLYLPQTKVGDAGLANLKGVTGLVNLYLDETKVTDAGLEHLKGMTGLKVLYLRHTPITDAGLKHLAAMPNLCWVDLWGTKVTDAGVKQLQAALPRCTIKNIDPQKDRPPPALPPTGLPVGRWSVAFANGVSQTCEIRPGGTVSVVEPLRTSHGKATVKDGLVVVDYEDNVVERWTPVGNRHVVEFWFPGTQFPTAKPLHGIAERTTADEKPHRAAEDDNPFKKVKEGDWAKYSMTMDRGGFKSVGDMTRTVTAKSDKEVTITTIMTLDGRKSLPRDEKFDLTKPYDPIWLHGLNGTDARIEKVGEAKEKVKIGTREYDCTVIKSKTRSKVGGIEYKTDNRLWTSKDAPLGGMVKMEVLGERGAPANTWLEFKESGSK